MADNTTTQAEALATVPAGEVFGFDDVDGVKIARSKTGFGVDGSYTDVSAADPLPVVQTGTPALPTGAATSANQDTLIAAVDGVEGLLTTIDADTGSIAASAATIAGAVSGTEMQVDVLTMPTVAVTDNAGSLTVDDGGSSLTVDGTVAVTGTFWQATQPVSLASVPSHAVTNAGTFAVQDSQKITDNGAFTDGTTKVQPVGFIFDEVAGTALTENDMGAARMDSKRAVVGVLEDATTRGQRAAVSAAGRLSVDASGVAVPITDNSGSITVDNAGTFAVQATLQSGTNGIGKLTANSGVDIGDVDVTSVVPGTGATNLGKAEDAAHSSGDTGVMALAVRTDTSAARATTDGDYIPLTTDAAGRLWVNEGTYNTAAVTSVADTATSTTLLAAAGTRRGFRITNTSSAVLYVKYGTTASATDFTVRLPQWAYLEENFYSGRVDAVWASDPGDGAALVTSLSA